MNHHASQFIPFPGRRERAIRATRGLGLSVCVAAGVAHAQVDVQPLLEGPLEPLKSAYLDCNEMALQSLLALGDAMACSMIYEAVKKRVFDGDFARLVEWSRTATDDRLQAKAPR